MNQKYSRRL
ncbi:hypothetical protein CP8484711_2080A, partial [Chlamydia psittaci 84-8471/1]